MNSHSLVGDSAILLREGCSKQLHLFLVHDEIGSLTYASILAPHISPETIIYGIPISSYVLEGLNTLQGMASRMVAMIREVQPHGPYRLAGYSRGGLIAYEIAVQLLGEDNSVEFLGVVDTLYTQSLKRQLSNCIILGQMLAEAIIKYHPYPIQAPVYLFSSTMSIEESKIQRDWERIVSNEWLNVVPILARNRSKVPNVAFVGQLMSEAIQDASARNRLRIKQQYSPLVTLQTGRSGGTLLFCVPGAGATIVSFTDLIGRLNQDWRIYGIQPRGMDGLSIPHTSLRAAVTNYIEAIQESHPDGPLHLLGHSYGGWAAYEMACRLRSAGREVASVTIVDSTAPKPGSDSVRQYTHMTILQQWVDLFEMQLAKPLGISMQDLQDLSINEQLVQIYDRLSHWRLMPKKSDPDSLHGPFHTFAAALRCQYTPKFTLHGAIHLVIADDSKLDEITKQRMNEKAVEGWRQWAPDLQVFYAGGNHLTVLKKPHVNALRDWLCRRLQSNCVVSARPIS